MEIAKTESQIEQYYQQIDTIEEVMRQHPAVVQIPVRHIFTNGLYSREITVKAGTLFTSKIHKTEHPFVLSQGIMAVITEAGKCEVLEAPYTGVTVPGTRRVLFAQTDCVWTTFHPTERTTVEEIEEDIIEKRDVPISEIELAGLEEYIKQLENT